MHLILNYIKKIVLINLSICTLCFGQNSTITSPTLDKLIKEAEIGIPESQFQLGILYRNGNGVPRELNTAFRWIKKAAEQDLTDAQAVIARMFEQGHGTEKNLKESVKWWEIAADKGNPFAQGALGFNYLSGHVLSKDIIKAERWLLLASKNNDKLSQFLLALLYDNCNHQPASIKVAFALVCESEAEELLNFHNPNSAAKWYRDAADSALPNAQFAIGLILSEGKVLPRDNIEAVMWLYLSYSMLPPGEDRDEAYMAFKRVKKKLSPSEELKAKKKVQTWKPKL